MKRSARKRQNGKPLTKSVVRTVGISLFVFCLCLSSAFAIGVVDTMHNLSAGGPGSVTSVSEDRVCIFCHTPHHADVISNDYMPLWSRNISAASYSLYTSSTIQAEPGQPTGGSRLCLSCHDGTIALGMLSGDYRPSDNSLGAIPVGPTNLSTDLSDDHPISFIYDNVLALASNLHDPASLPSEIRLEDGRLECTSCHDSHLNTFGNFLVMDNINSALCESCHSPQGWLSSTHHSPNAKCESCHTSHTAGQPSGLLLGADEESTCFQSCHNSIDPGVDIKSAFAKSYTHPIDTAVGVHDPVENPLSAAYHVECADCHNGHQVNSSVATAPDVSGALAGVSGVNVAGAVVDPALYEHEICFKCHSSNSFVSSTAVTRQINEIDQQLRFDATNPSFHPVAAVGKNPNVPSLRVGYTEGSRIYCTDCHNSDDGATAGGGAADGPHGSIYPHLLIDRYEQGNYPLVYVEDNYALCWRCHDPATLLAGGTFHARHVQGKEAPCSACHDPHGVPVSGGATVQANAYLINFDTTIVTSGVHDSIARTCTVSCHSLNPRSY